jgi:hypothetical protein
MGVPDAPEKTPPAFRPDRPTGQESGLHLKLDHSHLPKPVLPNDISARARLDHFADGALLNLG